MSVWQAVTWILKWNENKICADQNLLLLDESKFRFDGMSKQNVIGAAIACTAYIFTPVTWDTVSAILDRRNV